jgi:hypothetical protein
MVKESVQQLKTYKVKKMILTNKLLFAPICATRKVRGVTPL